MRKIYTNTITPGVNWGLKARAYDVIHYREGGIERLYYKGGVDASGQTAFYAAVYSGTDVMIYEILIDTEGVISNTQRTLTVEVG